MIGPYSDGSERPGRLRGSVRGSASDHGIGRHTVRSDRESCGGRFRLSARPWRRRGAARLPPYRAQYGPIALSQWT
eukprot:666821-Hanusia_phi.AAC.1